MLNCLGCFKVSGPLDLAAVGILAALAGYLRDRGVSIFTIFTFDTDYILVPGLDVDEAVDALEQAGHRVTGRSGSRRPRSPRPKGLRARSESPGGRRTPPLSSARVHDSFQAMYKRPPDNDRDSRRRRTATPALAVDSSSAQ